MTDHEQNEPTTAPETNTEEQAQPTETETFTPPRVSFGDLTALFVRMSVVAFGGPVAHIAVAEDEVVNRRKWITREHYLDLIAATNLIPGPNSTEVMIHVGYTMRGWRGAIVTGASFIIPAMLMTLVLAVIYVSSGDIPEVNAILWGVKPVIIAIIAMAGYRLVPSALKNIELWSLFVAATVVVFLFDIPEVLVMLGTGVIYAVYATHLRGGGTTTSMLAAFFVMTVQPALQQVQQATETAVRAGLGELFFYFLRIGAVLFGSGYILITYIEADLVRAFGWLSPGELIDAVAIGQLTPGPVLTTSTAIGYIVAGFPGAFVATLGIFLPSFVFVILSAPLIPKMRASKFMGAFLDGVNAGVIAAILVTVVALAGEALRPLGDEANFNYLGVVLIVVTLVALIRFKLNATWLIGLGALVGLVYGFIFG